LLVDRIRATAAEDLRIELSCELQGGEDRLTPQLEDTVYRVVQEALSNVVRHSGAARADVTVEERHDQVVVVVRDDGAGFVADGESSGFGLIGMRERVAFAEGELQIEASPGAGAVVRATLPAARTSVSEMLSATDTG
jgi:signal transduction histidine kinase